MKQKKNLKLDDLQMDGKKLSMKQMISLRGGVDIDLGSHPGRWT